MMLNKMLAFSGILSPQSRDEVKERLVEKSKVNISDLFFLNPQIKKVEQIGRTIQHFLPYYRFLKRLL